jgi:hypothetical protein
MPKLRRRTRRTEADWISIFRRFESSGLTVRGFCGRERLSVSSFQRWRSRLGRVGRAEFVELVPTQPAPAPTDWSLDIALPNGVQLRFRG